MADANVAQGDGSTLATGNAVTTEKKEGKTDGGLAAVVPGWLLVVIALVVVAVFAATLYSLWQLADDKNIQQVWDKRILLFEGVFTLASAIVGALFGVAVVRPQVKKAEEKADGAEQLALQKADEAAGAREDTERVRADILTAVASKASATLGIDATSEVMASPESALMALRTARDYDGPVTVSGGGGPGPVAAPRAVVSLEDVADAVMATR